jgi:phosphate transport system permease protein
LSADNQGKADRAFNALNSLQQETVTVPWYEQRVSRTYRRRQIVDKILLVLIIAAVVVVLFPLLDMLYLFAYRGLSVISLADLTETTTGGTGGLGGGGIYNAITGSLLLLVLSASISVPIGVLSGVYMAEFAGDHNRYASTVRFFSDVLAGVPSIVLGYVGYLLFVLYAGWGYSALAGAVTLSILMLPYILRTTELSIRRVPDSIREGAIALGSTKTSMINRLTLKFALPGIITGVMLAISISFSETAPLLYTANFSNYPPSALLHQPVAYITGIVWTFSQIPGTSTHNLAYVASFVLLSIVFLINFVSRVVLKRFSKI